MRSLLTRRKFELVAMLLATLFIFVHCHTSPPIAGLATSNEGTALHRFVQSIEGRVTDVLFRVRGARPAHPDVVVLELDEQGAQRWGLWPWPRDVMARVIDHLVDGGARVIALDVAFADETRTDETSKQVLQALDGVALGSLPEGLITLKQTLSERLANGPDSLLEAALRKGGDRIVQGVIPYNTSSDFSADVLARYRDTIAPSLITRTAGSVANSFKEIAIDRLPLFRITGVQTPLARFAATGTRFGHFGTVTDVDGTIRRAATLAKVMNPPGLMPSLGLQGAAAFLNASIEPVIEQDELLAVNLRKPDHSAIRVPFQDEVSFTLLNYPGPVSSFRHVSVVDVYDNTFQRELIDGKLVMIGVTLVGSSGDQRVTPFEEYASGIVTHAALASNILSNDFLDRPASSMPLELVSMLVFALGLGLTVPRVSFRWKIGIVGLAFTGWSVVAYVAFTHGLRLAWFVPSMHLVVTAFALIFLGYLSVDREKLKLRSTFSRYLGEEVMDVALADPEKLNRGEKRDMTVLFSDIRGFTSLAEHMSPEKLASFINEYLSPMTRIVFDEKGTLDKYIGDAVMAFWNAPIDQADHATRACRAAVMMLRKLDELKVGWRAAGYPELEIGIGINTGPMVVGNMGSDVRVDYTVLGDSVNLGSRLEATNKEYETRIVISETTWAASKDAIVARRLGAVRVKGRREPVRIYELRGLTPATEAELAAIARFEVGLDAWQARQFEEARVHFEAVRQLWPNDPPCRLYLEAIESFAEKPPDESWDGVFTMTTK